ncbi:MAG: glycosyltransferase family 2 protein [Chloroflexota bacterium]
MDLSHEPPLVSIITPSFNQVRYIEQTIQSVFGQNYAHLEYLLVDGASTDGSLEIIQKYTDKISWWVSEPDTGQSAAINKGLRRAQGEYVAWLNSDDIYLPGAIERAVSVFEEDPGIGLVFGDVLAIDQNGQTTNRLRYGDWSLPDLMAFRVIGQPSVFMRRSVLGQAGFLDLSYHYLLDHQLWLRMAQLAQIRHIPAMLSAARFHPDSKNVAQAARFGEEAFRILEWMETQPALEPVLSENRSRIKAGARRLSAFYLLDGGQAGTSLREYARAFRLHPPTVLRDWKHVLYALLSLLGLNRLGDVYMRLRKGLTKRT